MDTQVENPDVKGNVAQLQTVINQRNSAMDEIARLVGVIENIKVQYRALETKYNALQPPANDKPEDTHSDTAEQ